VFPSLHISFAARMSIFSGNEFAVFGSIRFIEFATAGHAHTHSSATPPESMAEDCCQKSYRSPFGGNLAYCLSHCRRFIARGDKQYIFVVKE